MILHSFLFCASLTNSPYSDVLLHSQMLSIHSALGLPLLLLPSIFPSNNNLCMLSRRIMWPKKDNFLFLIAGNTYFLTFMIFNTSSLLISRVQDIFSIISYMKSISCTPSCIYPMNMSMYKCVFMYSRIYKTYISGFVNMSIHVHGACACEYIRWAFMNAWIHNMCISQHLNT